MTVAQACFACPPPSMCATVSGALLESTRTLTDARNEDLIGLVGPREPKGGPLCARG